MITHKLKLHLKEDQLKKFGFQPCKKSTHWAFATISLQKDRISDGCWQIISSSLSSNEFHDKYKIKMILSGAQIKFNGNFCLEV